jgi:hypothetical protein
LQNGPRILAQRIRVKIEKRVAERSLSVQFCERFTRKNLFLGQRCD